MPPPVPPKVKLGRITVGRPICSQRGAGFVHGMGDAAAGGFDADFRHGVAEFQPVLGAVDDVGAGADQLHTIFFQHAGLGEFHGGIERGLAAHGGQQRVRLFAGDDAVRRSRA